MPDEKTLAGFPEETIEFFRRLEVNNNREWFQEHREDYEEHVVSPAKSFVVDMGKRLRLVSPDIQAVPKTNQSLFRINRDTRFSKDKRPYKTNLGVFFWEGTARKRMECSGYYVHVDTSECFLGAGMHVLPKDLLNAFRDRIQEASQAKELNRILEAVTRHQGIAVGGKTYKRVPRGWQANSENEELLKHSGLYVHLTFQNTDVLHSPDFIDFCFDYFEIMAPVHRWLVELQ